MNPVDAASSAPSCSPSARAGQHKGSFPRPTGSAEALGQAPGAPNPAGREPLAVTSTPPPASSLRDTSQTIHPHHPRTARRTLTNSAELLFHPQLRPKVTPRRQPTTRAATGGSVPALPQPPTAPTAATPCGKPRAHGNAGCARTAPPQAPIDGAAPPAAFGPARTADGAAPRPRVAGPRPPRREEREAGGRGAEPRPATHLAAAPPPRGHSASCPRRQAAGCTLPARRPPLAAPPPPPRAHFRPRPPPLERSRGGERGGASL